MSDPQWQQQSGQDAPEPPHKAPVAAIKGRGAASQISGRFETQRCESEDDGWYQEDSPVVFKTCVSAELAKSILSHNQSPDLPFSVSLNPYRGCEHGCIYCYARPSHAYLGLSPGLDFETKLFAKTNAAQLLRQELASPTYQPATIAIGVNTDAYQPCEKTWRITEQVLQVLQECRHPCGLITKSALIERDIPLLAQMAADNLVTVAITLTTLDAAIARILEPRAASPLRRLKTIERLRAAGIPVVVSIAPIIPFITDADIEKLLSSCAQAGAQGAGFVVLRLPWEVNPLFQEWLQVHFPDRAERVMNRIRDMRGGAENVSEFGARMRGEGLYADLIQQRFAIACKRAGLNQQRSLRPLNCQLFRKPLAVPAKSSPHNKQADLFS